MVIYFFLIFFQILKKSFSEFSFYEICESPKPFQDSSYTLYYLCNLNTIISISSGGLSNSLTPSSSFCYSIESGIPLFKESDNIIIAANLDSTNGIVFQLVSLDDNTVYKSLSGESDLSPNGNICFFQVQTSNDIYYYASWIDNYLNIHYIQFNFDKAQFEKIKSISNNFNNLGKTIDCKGFYYSTTSYHIICVFIIQDGCNINIYYPHY